MRLLLICVLSVAGCGLMEPRATAPETAAAPPDFSTGTPTRPQARPADAAPGIADPTPPPDEVSVGTLGRTIASLGNAAEPGLWLKTPLVTSERAGQVYYPDTGKTVAVTLIPIDAPRTAGSRLSLAAMQALGAPLTGLPEVDVLAG
ncbi:hypothetical protein [uncultured Tateyamaria sp.]|uniref:hypothetical protein n=1 Tax=uncultured Tateyamaria sp. TaxID=455651 RepID=UPI00260C77C0|nr:hypothetical protein [uncultured Tateyamaria sp.]